MDRAARIIADRAACYVRKGNKYDIQVRSHSLTELDLLQRTFGGGIYSQSSARRPTWVWRAGSKKDLQRIAKEVFGYWDKEGNPRLAPLFELYDGLLGEET